MLLELAREHAAMHTYHQRLRQDALGPRRAAHGATLQGQSAGHILNCRGPLALHVVGKPACANGGGGWRAFRGGARELERRGPTLAPGRGC